MTKLRENQLCFVQFLHPGREHHPDDGHFKAWNRHKHKRKFMVCPGRSVRRSKVIDTELVFWGEWEPESEVVCEFAQSPPLPRYLYRPFYVVPDSYKDLQNTDPFVFGGFFYGNCMQHKNGSDTQLHYLDRGSVILFGSCVSEQFLLDTVFVVDHWIGYDGDSYKSALNRLVPSAYVDVVLKPLFLSGRGRKEGCPPDRGKDYRLYFGATHAAPVDGMFSFFPCMPHDRCSNGFERPVINIPPWITDNLPRGFRLNRQVDCVHVRDLWDSVVDQVVEQDLWLGIQAQMPGCRRARR